MTRKIILSVVLNSSCVAFCTLLLFSCAPRRLVRTSVPPEPAFGNTELPIWSNLTDFDAMALRGADKARQGYPDALLALGLFASGDVRDAEIFAAYRKRVLAFVEEVRLSMGGDTDEFNKGRILYSSMCQRFFKQRLIGDELKGYDFRQSKLSEVFRSATFNCISSTLLYIILARYFGLNVNAALIPSHAFVQQTLRDGTTVEIETTSKNGYNFKNDKSGFERLRKDWFKSRGLAMPTYEDYAKRQVLSPLHVVVHNMVNQHTASDLMAKADRYRLLEAMGFCCPEVKAFAYSRLVALYNEAMELQNAKDLETLSRFYAKMLPTILSLDSAGSDDTAFFDLTASLRLGYGYTLFKSTGSAVSLDTIETVAAQLKTNTPNYKMLVNNACVMLQWVVEKWMGENKFEESVAVAERFCRYPDFRPTMTYLESFVYGNWAFSLWPKREWSTVVRLLRKAISMATTDEVRKPFISNIKGAYFNWAVQRYNEKNLEESLSLLKTCEAEFGLESDGLNLKNKILAVEVK
jgi:hypothetical protein